jgi:hypothetical protein
MPEALALTELGRLEVAAASGLVGIGEHLYVVADDELDLLVLDKSGRSLDRVPLFPGQLPDEHHARKGHKPDLEALALLTPDTLLAIPSGSTVHRSRGAAVFGLDITPVELGPLYAALLEEMPDLNIEGAAVLGERLLLLQRGNGAAGHNAVVDLELAGVRAAIAAGEPLGAGLIRAIAPVALGDLDGVALGFTDASPLPDGRLLFVAAAEAGGSTYDDGAAAGSILGLLDCSGGGAVVRGRRRLAPRDKIEGLHAVIAGDRLRMHLVADGDDRSLHAPLYGATLPLSALASATLGG